MAVLRAARNGHSAGGFALPQRPHGGHPDRMKVQSTPLKNIGKPRVERITQDIPSLAVKGKSLERTIPVLLSALTITPQSHTNQGGKKICLLENIQWRAGKEEARMEV